MFIRGPTILKPTRKLATFILLRFYSNQNLVRVRFAPSPTGYLHLGGLRTALYNYLFAKANNGKFILRIEDTDQSRIVPGAIEALQQDLEWSGIEIHEGPTKAGEYGPYIQSERLNLYKQHVETLVENKSAYLCFCTDKRLQLLRREAIKMNEIPKYDNRCRHLSQHEVDKRLTKGDSYCIRFKISDKEEGFNDLIFGDISYNISLNEGDPVIMKTDGYPTYHFANVVDDHLMDITHVLRGVEWQISTTKHILLYRAFGWTPPHYAHLPLLMNADGTKLSKRQGDIKINYYKENGMFPLALINFIVHSGGGFAKDEQRHLKPRCYSIDELATQFDITRINSYSGKLMSERLLEFNRLALKKYLQQKDTEQKLIEEVKVLIKNKVSERVSDKYITDILHWSSDRISKLTDLISNDLLFIWSTPRNSLDNLNDKDIKIIGNLIEEFKSKDIGSCNKDQINIFLKEFSKEYGVKYGSFMKLLRGIISGLKEGPSVAEMIEILGTSKTLERLQTSIRKNHV